MKAAMGGRYLELALGMAALALGAIMLLEWGQGQRLERDFMAMRKIPVTEVPAQKILPEFSLPAPDVGFRELLSRPVFTITRRFPVASDPVASAMKKGQFVLVGVLVTPGQQSALLRDAQTNKTETVAAGAILRGMTVGKVEPNRVVLRLGDESEEVILAVQRGAKLPPGSAPTQVMPASVAGSPQLFSPPPPFTKPSQSPSVPRPLTPEEIAVSEKQYQATLDDMRKKGLPLPTEPPPWRNSGK